MEAREKAMYTGTIHTLEITLTKDKLVGERKCWNGFHILALEPIMSTAVLATRSFCPAEF